uniref:Uncharacterized protein n=1 Tax=Arundo donax TaxID=35708 RepID=A0A0A9H3F3_ARUDO
MVEEATASELFGEPSPSDPSIISLSSSGLGCPPRSFHPDSIHGSVIVRDLGSLSEVDACFTCESLVVASVLYCRWGRRGGEERRG